MIVCCDKNALPRADKSGKFQIDRVNRIRLPAGVWITVNVFFPSTIETLADPGGHIIAVPETEIGTDVTLVKQSNEPTGNRAIFLHAIGQWRVRNTGGTDVEAKIIDAHNGIAALYQAAIRVAGTVSLSPISGGSIAMGAPSVVAVGAASGQLFAANANRKFWYAKNTDPAKVVSLGFDGNAAVAGSGVVLNPGEWVSMQSPGEAQSVGQINAIASAASANVAIQEGS